jgi:hypothetical protein
MFRAGLLPSRSRQPAVNINTWHTNCAIYRVVEASWNVMAHAQKPYFVFRRNGRVHLNRRRRRGGGAVKSTTGSWGVRISGSNAGYTMFRGSVKGTGCPLHSPVSPSLLLPCVTVCHHISTGVYLLMMSSNAKVNYWNKLKVNSPFCWLLLYGYITMHGTQNFTKTS